MIEQWIGKHVTIYIMSDDSPFADYKLVGVDSLGIYAEDLEDPATTYFLPFSSVRHVARPGG